MLLRRRKCGPAVCRLTDLPATLSSMPALRALELHGVSYLSSDHTRELSAARRPAFARLTSLALSCDERSLAAQPAPALHQWLAWALPAATQLRKLSLSCETLSLWHGVNRAGALPPHRPSWMSLLLRCCTSALLCRSLPPRHTATCCSACNLCRQAHVTHGRSCRRRH